MQGQQFTEEQYNALTSVAKVCNKEMKGVSKDNVAELAKITTKHLNRVKPMGFTKVDLLVEIGRINGVLKDKRKM